jgi:hypothetical protein
MRKTEAVMQASISPTLATVIFAAATAASAAAAASVPWPVHRAACVSAALYAGLAAYAVYLARCTRRPLRAVAGPLAVTAAVAATAGSVATFALPAAAALAWIRSGICCAAAARRRWVVELVVVAGGLMLADLLCDLRPGLYGRAAGVWGFGLAQAGYFAWCEAKDPAPEAPPAPARFARAHVPADALLRERKLEKAFEELGL